MIPGLLAAIRGEGVIARKQGIAIEDNPYAKPPASDKWREGWRDMIGHVTRQDFYDAADSKADENILKWGFQDIPLLLLVTMEELGELSQAHLQREFEGGDLASIMNELDDLTALCGQMYDVIQKQLDEEGMA